MSRPVVEQIADSDHLYIFWCPGCEYAHHIDTRRWQFNGDMHKPTCSPSLLQVAGPRCHIFVKDGRIQFLADCDHALAGQTVDMEPCP